MALEFCDGFDNHNALTANLTNKWKNGSFTGFAYTLSNTLGVQGTAGLQISRNGSSWKGFLKKTSALRGATEDFFVVMWFKPSLAATLTTVTHVLILTNDKSCETSTGAYSAPSTSTVSQLELCLLPSGYLELRMNNTVLATASTTVLELGNWYFLQVRARIDSTSGEFEVKIGATTELTFSGGTYTGGGSAGIRYVVHATSNNTSGNQYIIDDPIYFTGAGDTPNAFFTNPKIITQKQPNAAGSVTQGTPSTGANYTCVDEVPPNTTDYVDFAAVGDADTYGFADLGAGTGIEAVVINTVCRTTGTTNRKYKGRCKSDSSVGYGPEVEALLDPTTYYTQQSPVAVDPATGSAWSGYAAVDAAEFGLEVTV